MTETCRNDTENKNPKIVKTKNRRIIQGFYQTGQFARVKNQNLLNNKKLEDY